MSRQGRKRARTFEGVKKFWEREATRIIHPLTVSPKEPQFPNHKDVKKNRIIPILIDISIYSFTYSQLGISVFAFLFKINR